MAFRKMYISLIAAEANSGKERDFVLLSSAYDEEELVSDAAEAVEATLAANGYGGMKLMIVREMREVNMNDLQNQLKECGYRLARTA